MVDDEKIYVGITTWSARIGNIVPVLESILAQTIKPDKIVLSVCVQDFPHMYEDFPGGVLSFLEGHSSMITVRWFLENYKGWKKHLGLLESSKNNELLVCVDDDHIYPNDFIEKLYKSYLYYGKSHPITWNRKFMTYDLWPFCGMGTLYRRSDWGSYQKYLTHDVLYECLEDDIIDFIFAANKTVLYPIIYDVPPHETFHFNPVNSLSDSGRDNYPTIRKTMDTICDEIYCRSNGIEPESNLYTPRFWLVFSGAIEKARREGFPASDAIDKHMNSYPLFTYTESDPHFVKEYLSETL